MELRVCHIHCIENKKNHEFEENCMLMVESALASDREYFTKHPTFMLQPTENDISDNLNILISDTGISYEKQVLKTVQLNDNINYTVIPDTCKYFSDNLECDYLLWHDLDVLLLKNHKWLYQKTNKVVTCILNFDDNGYDTEDLYNHNRFNEYYVDIFRDHIESEYRVDSLLGYVNTFYVYAPRCDSFWSEWQKLTHHLVGIIQLHYADKVNDELESICEEMAASILYSLSPAKFENINTNISLSVDLINPKSTLIHYGKFSNFKRGDIGSYVYDIISGNILKSLLRKKSVTFTWVKELIMRKERFREVDCDLYGFKIPLTNKCNLKCKFCSNCDNIQNTHKVIPPDKVYGYIDFSIKWGSDTIVLGSGVGEPLLYDHNYMRSVLDYCEKSTVKDVVIITSLSSINKKTLYEVISGKYKKVSLLVSIYGCSKEDFVERTNVDFYDSMIENLRVVGRSQVNVVYLNRTGKPFVYGEVLKHVTNIDDDPAEDFNFNSGKFKGEVKIPYRKGACKYTTKHKCGINYKDELVICAWLDVNIVIGNIQENIDTLIYNHQLIIDKQENNIFNVVCANCDGYSPIKEYK